MWEVGVRARIMEDSFESVVLKGYLGGAARVTARYRMWSWYWKRQNSLESTGPGPVSCRCQMGGLRDRDTSCEVWSQPSWRGCSPLCHYTLYQPSLPTAVSWIICEHSFYMTLQVADRNTKQARAEYFLWTCSGSSKYAFRVMKDFGL